MANIPIDLQRKFEQRWAARFVRPSTPQKQEFEREDEQLISPAMAKEETNGLIKPEGIRSAPAV